MQEAAVSAVAERVLQYFTARCRHSGNLSFKAGRVVLTTANSEEVIANVFDNPECRVRLRLEQGRLIAGCTCGHYEESSTPCKHVWAALLAAEAEGALTAPSTPGAVALVWDPEWKNVAWDRQGLNTMERPRESAPTDRRTRQIQSQRADQTWRDALQMVHQYADRLAGPLPPSQRPRYEIWYVFDIPATFKNEHLVLQVLERRLRPDGTWATPVPRSPARLLADGPQPLPDAWILLCLAGPQSDLVYVPDAFSDARSQFLLEPGLRDILVPWVARTGRCFVRRAPDAALEPIEWDDREWKPDLEIVRHPSGSGWVLRGSLVQGDERLDLSRPDLLLSGGLVFVDRKVARLQDGLDFPWISLLRKQGELAIADDEIQDFMNTVFSMPTLPQIRWPEELQLKTERVQPTPVVRIQSRAGKNAEGRSRAHALLAFDYAGHVVGALDRRPEVLDYKNRRRLPRDWEFEQQTRAFLNNLGFRQGYALNSTRGPAETERFQISPRLVQRALRQLLRLGWYVELAGRRVRTRGTLNLEIRSAVDWFELRGAAHFGDQVVTIPELLAALRRGQETIVLRDGSRAYIPEEWRNRYALLAAVATTDGEVARYHRSQVGLLDALLAAREDVQFDREFEELRERLRQFKGVRPASPPRTFQGKLRSYQREGLGWMKFLQEFGFGGCLADDMGLGKTVQVIALLEQRRLERTGQSGRKTRSRKRTSEDENETKQSIPPSLVIVPKSLVFNWLAEFARFAPEMRVLEHTGSNRSKDSNDFQNYDVILTTYGTVRRDILVFKDFEFDYVVLDEAQAIKNADSDTAKAVRLLRSRYRLALSGTPIENHLGELWSLFEFLNPGMLGGAKVFRDRVGAGTTMNEESRQVLARALRPFILRRTKQQVAKDLPERVEQTLVCEMSPEQATLYAELRDHYRQSLLGRIREYGIGNSTMHVLEALLRLRQAACHPGLLDPKYRDLDGGKLELLLEQLKSIVAEDHKVLVFSQFTTLLEIVRERLDSLDITYEYLDGRTRDRQQRVERFQTDPDCRVFLISLKAGGVGLNLTAAEYVILLDPWWNPAVEAQAIDRAHRIGQTRTVFAYRLISKGTVEEKILQLQSLKKDLADSIITAENSLLKNLTAEDIELLLQ